MAHQGYTVRHTMSGYVRGMSHSGVARFLGIPYGASTAGAGRWRRARPPESWHGIRDALTFGPAAPQVDLRIEATGIWPQVLDLIYPRSGAPTEGMPMGEDCLVLNVWAPSEVPADGLPVMVWFHGGGFHHGAGSEMFFSGDAIARTGRAIVVTVNHRIGLMGFLALDHLLGDGYAGSGQVGVDDMVVALEWVSDNIESFGGDPGRITIFGQSGGGAKVATLLAMPHLEGSIHGAILQSGPIRWFQTPDRARDVTSRVLDAAGLTEVEADLLLELPLRSLLAIQRRGRPLEDGSRPIIDGDLIPAEPFHTEAASHLAEVPLMIGTTSHEMSLLLSEREDYAGLTYEQLPEAVAHTHGDAADTAVTAARTAHPEEPAPLVLARILTQASFTASAVTAATRKSRQAAPVYAYEFAYQTDALGGLLGATHSLEIPYVFGTVARSPFAGARPDRFRVSERVRDAWISFAETGSPNHPDIPDWPTYDETTRSTMVIDTHWKAVSGPDCDLNASPSGLAMWPDAWVAASLSAPGPNRHNDESETQ
jgi:para-nitrobenzyl esterase